MPYLEYTPAFCLGKQDEFKRRNCANSDFLCSCEFPLVSVLNFPWILLGKLLTSWVCQVRTGLPNSENVFLGRQRKMFDGRLLRRLSKEGALPYFYDFFFGYAYIAYAQKWNCASWQLRGSWSSSSHVCQKNLCPFALTWRGKRSPPSRHCKI